MRHDDPRPVRYDARWAMHLMLTAILIWVAGRLWWPDETFATSPAWRGMAQLMPEDRWAAVICASAIFGLVGLWDERPAVQFVTICVVATMHGIIAGFLLWSGGAILPGVLLLNALGGYYLLGRRAYAAV